jgi:hypothetical protein
VKRLELIKKKNLNFIYKNLSMKRIPTDKLNPTILPVTKISSIVISTSKEASAMESMIID